MTDGFYGNQERRSDERRSHEVFQVFFQAEFLYALEVVVEEYDQCACDSGVEVGGGRRTEGKQAHQITDKDEQCHRSNQGKIFISFWS